MLTNRQKLLLKAIVEEYVKQGTPIGSKSLIDKPYLQFSSATLRFEMAKLEELGFLEKTHTSSGRVPSRKGYQYYVDNLLTRDYDVIDDFPSIDEIFSVSKYSNREDTIKKALDLITDLTNYTAVALGPDLEQSRIKKIDLILIDNSEAVLLIVTNFGNIQNFKISIPENVDGVELKKIIDSLNELLQNVPLTRVSRVINQEISKIQLKQYMEYQETLLETFLNIFEKFAESNYFVSGVSNIFHQKEFQEIEVLEKIVDSLVNKNNLIKLISNNPNNLSVRIGGENEITHMDNCTIISVPYRVTDDNYGKIAIIGPTRMEYRKVIPLVEYLAKNMSKLYND